MKKNSQPEREERLRDALTELKLHRMSEIVADAARKAAEDEVGYLEFLEQLVAQEAAYRHERMVTYRIAAARLPFKKTLDQYDFSHPSKINKQKVLELFDLSFVERKENAIFVGPTGVGKTHLTVALAWAACEANIPTRFTTAIEMVNELTASLADSSFVRKIKQYTRPKLLVLDELGYLPIDHRGADIVFQVVTSRYERGSIVLTTNRPFKQWGTLLNQDNVAASALIDRLAHHASVIVVQGDSYRMKGKDKETQLGMAEEEGKLKHKKP